MMTQKLQKVIVCGNVGNLKLPDIAGNLGYNVNELWKHEFDFLLGVYLDAEDKPGLTAEAEIILSEACPLVLMGDKFGNEALLDALAAAPGGLLHHSSTHSTIKSYFVISCHRQTNMSPYTDLKYLLTHTPLTRRDIADWMDIYNECITE